MERYITPSRKIFYVYEHWRPDKDVCFWVGKGKNARAYWFKRNHYYNNVVKKLAKLGMCVEVRMVESGLLEQQALKLEVERIAFWRASGVKLANLTDGGEGVSGLVHSDETKRGISLKKKGKKNPAHGDRMRGVKHTEEHNLNISAGLIARNYSPSIETRALLSVKNVGQQRTKETCENLRISHLGSKQSKDTIEKRRISLDLYWEQHPEARKIRGDSVRKAYDNPEVRKNHREGRARYNSNPEFAQQRREATIRAWITRRKQKLPI